MDTKLVEKECREVCKSIWNRHFEGQTNDLVLAMLMNAYYSGYEAGLEKAKEIYTEERQPA